MYIVCTLYVRCMYIGLISDVQYTHYTNVLYIYTVMSRFSTHFGSQSFYGINEMQDQ